jgi:hypothetical protein
MGKKLESHSRVIARMNGSGSNIAERSVLTHGQ